jgi:integrase
MLFKRQGSENYYCKFSIGGREIYRSTGTRDKGKAEAVAAKLHSELFNQVKLGSKPRHLWQEAVIKFIEESVQKRSIETEKSHLRWLSTHLNDKYLDDISTDTIEAIISAKLKSGAGTTRVNRTTGVISAILNKAHKQWGWLDKLPYIRKFEETGQRLRWLTHDEAEMLLAALPEHTAAMARFSLLTGLRESNVTKLEWNQINMQTRLLWIHADQAKGKKVIRVPLNDDAIAVLRQQLGKHCSRVFTYKGDQIDKVSTKLFRNAVKKLGLKDVCWHTLRHTWASWHVQAGTPLNVLQELGGWSDYAMVQRYAHLAPEHLADYAAKITMDVKKESPDLKLVSG